MIRSIIERTGVKIDVEDDGRVNVASADEASAQKAISIIQELTATPELNKTYMGKVQRITDFGAFVEIMPGLDGLLHVSEIAHYRVKEVRDELKEGEQVMVKVINIDPSGKIRLSRKALIDPPEGGVPPAGEGGPREGGERPPRREGGRPDGGRGGYRGDRDRDRGGDRGPRGGHDRRPEGGHERRPLPDNTRAEATEVGGASRVDEPSGGEKD
jgi:polyribonucleotide nucleotidyltransferase